MKQLTIAIVGAGRVGTVLVKRLTQAGFRITEIISSGHRTSGRKARRLAKEIGARVSTPSNALLRAGIVWFCVPDSEISKVALQLRNRDWNRKIAFHSSGLLSSNALSPLRKKGAAVASLHPLMTFVPGTLPELQNVTFAIEGDAGAVAEARNTVRALGGEVLRLRKDNKPAYHAFATMVCPLLISLLASSEKVGKLGGIPQTEVRRCMMPIVRQTLDNYFKRGAAVAFTGPIARGDIATVEQHLRALSGRTGEWEVYVSLARVALEHLSAKNQANMGALLDRLSRGKTLRSRKRTGRVSSRSARRS